MDMMESFVKKQQHQNFGKFELILTVFFQILVIFFLNVTKFSNSLDYIFEISNLFTQKFNMYVPELLQQKQILPNFSSLFQSSGTMESLQKTAV